MNELSVKAAKGVFVTTGVVVTMAWVTFLYRVGTGLLG
jgi:hypothetical protein